MEQQDVKNNPLGTEKITKLIRKFAVPCIISLLVSALYNIVDQIFIGQGVGYLGNAATNVVFPLTVIATSFAVLIGDGAAAYLSLNLGRNDKKAANKGVNNSLVLSVIVGVLFLVIGLVFKDNLLRLFGVTDSIYEYANGYMTWIVLGLPFYIITTSLNSMIRADGSPRYAMITMLIGAIINIILDPIAIFVLKMGVEGAAIATIVGQIISAVISIRYIKKFKTVKITKDDLKLEAKTVKKVCSLGVSSFITQIAITIVVITENNLLGIYGANSTYGSDIALSALGIVMKVNQIIISIIVGIAVGAQPIIGFNYGAKNYARVIKTYSVSVKIALTVGIIGTLVFQICPQVIINLFGQENELYNEFAQMCFRIYLMFMAFNSVQITSSIFFQAIGKSVKSAILSLSRQILFLIPAMIILPMFLGLEGILWAGPVADGLAFLITVVFITIEIKTIKKITNNVQEEKEQVETKTKKGIVITIGREFGSGGKYIGEQLAKRLNIKLYDEELLKRVSKECNIDINLLKEADEKQKKSFWYTMAMSSFSTTDSVNSLTQLPTDDKIFIEEAKVIEEIAENETCIMIGRCSNVILKDKPNVINIFVYSSDLDFKVKRKMKLENLTEKEAKKQIAKIDKERAAYHAYFTDEKWGNRDGYDLCIDTSKIGVDNAVELIEKYVRIKESKKVTV